MKRRLIFMLLAILSVATIFSSCKKDDDKDEQFTIDKQAITLVHDGTETIVASEAATWSSDNEFVATVDDKGVITGNHIGEAIITATAKGKLQNVKVTVKAKYNTITEPIMDFSLTREQVKEQATGILSQENESGLSYFINSSKSQLNMYIFEETTGKLKQSAWGAYSLTEVSPSDLVGFLVERYQPVTMEDGYYFFINSNKLESATMYVTFTANKGNLMVLYSSYNNRKS